MTPAPKRRWFRFSLRTLFVVVTISGIALGWVAYQLNWIRQRRELVHRTDIEALMWADGDYPTAPGLMWLFGEQGYDIIEIIVDLPIDPTIDVPPDRERTETETALLERARSLFPEAEVVKEVSLAYMRLIQQRPPAPH
jgi:hypothetical protein